MCGIVGLINFNNNSTESQALGEKLIQTLKHRGPDYQEVYTKQFCSLGHARLSIIDVHDRANQPMEKHGLVIVFNGEIYNHRILRKKLEKNYACTGSTTGDTEVIIDLFNFEGPKAFSQLEGMFAFSIYDLKTKIVYLVRDYFGIKPLYFSQFKHQQFVFASEMKAFNDIPGFKKNINPMALTELLEFNWVTKNQCFIENVECIPAAHYYEIHLDSLVISKHKYWDLEEAIEKQRIDFPVKYKDQKEIIHQALNNSMERHLVCDVPMGIFLSGGLDSSIIASMVHKRGVALQSFSVSFAQEDNQIEQSQDDGIWAQKIAKDYNLNHHHLELKSSHLEELENVIYHLDTPIGDPAAINAYLLSRLAKQNGIKVVHTGMGADEIFGGYRRHMALSHLSKIQHFIPSNARNLISQIAKGMPSQFLGKERKAIRWTKRVASFWNRSLDLAYLRSFSYYDPTDLSQVLLDNRSPEFIEKSMQDFSEVFNAPIMKNHDVVNKMCYTDLYYFLEGLNLKYMDKMSMAHGVEARVPFVDKELIVKSMCVPGKYKIPFLKNTSKYILKNIGEDYLDKKIIYRPKSSFGMPIRSWILKDKYMQGLMEKHLSKRALEDTNLFSWKKVHSMIEMNKNSKVDNSYQIYQLLSIQMWANRFC